MLTSRWIHKRFYEAVNYRLRTFAGGRYASSCRPTSIALLLTERCNARCVHCDIWQNRGREDSPDLRQWQALLTDLRGWLGPVQVVITGGDKPVFQDGRFRSPKRDLIAGVTIALETGALRISQRLPEAGTLTKELLNMRVRISNSGHDTYEAWRQGEHDDLVLALALALWRARTSIRRSLGVARRLWW